MNAGHVLESGDLKTSFLRGGVDPRSDGKAAMLTEPSAGLKKWLKLKGNEASGLEKAGYGLAHPS